MIKKEKAKKSKRSPVAAACSTLGTLLLAALVIFCLPLTVPRVFGFHIYTVVSGSMEPAIPVGSLLYIQKTRPQDMAKDDIIAFYGGKDAASIITHRVVENRVLMGEFITKGDANAKEDVSPIPYDDFIGKVRLSIPKAGAAAQVFSSTAGKVTAVCLIGLAVVLQMAAALAEKAGEGKG